MAHILDNIPLDLLNFLIVLAFSLLIGLEQRVHHIQDKPGYLFGTDRTFTLIGILGFVLYIITPGNIIPFVAGGIGILILLTVYYYLHTKQYHDFGVTSIVIALLTYSLTPLVYLNNRVLTFSVFVSIIILTGIKEDLKSLASKFDPKEFLTLAKFIILSGVILPLLPKEPIFPGIELSLYKMWLAVIAVSTISYLSYILKKFVFPDAGIILTAILGGLYSSTATTIILAKKSKNERHSYTIAAGIILATTMMYLRLLLLAFIFNKEIALKLIPYFLIPAFVGAMVAFYFYKKDQSLGKKEHLQLEAEDANPLELKTALIFGFLFAFFSILTDYILNQYGQKGIEFLSLIVGVTDIDPFVLNLFQNGLSKMSLDLIVKSVVLATIGNNIIKMIYAVIWGDKSIKKPVIIGFVLIIFTSLLLLGF